MFLLYINELGKDYKGQRQYEFIFGKHIDENVINDNWFMFPSSGLAQPPEVKYIDLVGLLKNSDLELDLIQNSDYFGVIDAVDGVVALGWEKFDMDENDRSERLSFHYGETIESVAGKLTTKGFRLINDELKYKFS